MRHPFKSTAGLSLSLTFWTTIGRQIFIELVSSFYFLYGAAVVYSYVQLLLNTLNKGDDTLNPRSLTLNKILEGIGLAGNVNSFSTPPVSFQCMSLLVGGARSNVVTMSDVLLSWFFISSPDIFFTSSTISLRLRFVFVMPVFRYSIIILRYSIILMVRYIIFLFK